MTNGNASRCDFKAQLPHRQSQVNIGYWTERAVHRQTGPRVTFDNAGNSASQWLDNTAAYLLRGDGQPYQARDWKTISKGTSLFLQDSISLMQDKLSLQIGVRNSSIDRDSLIPNVRTYGVGSGRLVRNQNAPTQSCQALAAKYNLDAEPNMFSSTLQKTSVRLLTLSCPTY